MFLRKRRTLFVLIVVALLSAWSAACDRAGSACDCSGADSDADSDTDADADTDTWDTDTADTETGSDDCTTHIVASPAPGTAATQEAICAAAPEAVISNGAAAVALQMDGSNPDAATGSAAIPVAVLPYAVGLPQIRIVDASSEALLDGAVSAIAEAAGGFSFAVAWAPGSVPAEAGDASLVLEVVLEVACEAAGDGGAATKLVSSLTYVDLCTGGGAWSLEWVSSGGECTVCENITDPMDLPPAAARAPDGIALPSAIDLEIVPVLSFGRSIALVAEAHDWARPLAYSWHAAAGELSARDGGGVVWRLPAGPGPHLVQVVADDGDSAAVAAFTVGHRL